MADFALKIYQKFRRFITFGLVGCVNTLLDITVFTICINLFSMSPEYSQATGYAAGLLCSFILNKRFTFRDWTRELKIQIIAFLAVNCVSWYISATLILHIVGFGVNVYVAKLIVTGVVMLINYFGYKSLVFNVSGTKKGDETD